MKNAIDATSSRVQSLAIETPASQNEKSVGSRRGFFHTFGQRVVNFIMPSSAHRTRLLNAEGIRPHYAALGSLDRAYEKGAASGKPHFNNGGGEVRGLVSGWSGSVVSGKAELRHALANLRSFLCCGRRESIPEILSGKHDAEFQAIPKHDGVILRDIISDLSIDVPMSFSVNEPILQNFFSGIQHLQSEFAAVQDKLSDVRGRLIEVRVAKSRSERPTLLNIPLDRLEKNEKNLVSERNNLMEKFAAYTEHALSLLPENTEELAGAGVDMEKYMKENSIKFFNDKHEKEQATLL